ncbi:MAG: hypothetical protein JWO68_475 [Actinomycetia bacterium]|nr:hypothetical protein [Actinomycetes bacterium]
MTAVAARRNSLASATAAVHHRGVTEHQREMLRRRVLGVPTPEIDDETNERASDEDDASDVRLVASAA